MVVVIISSKCLHEPNNKMWRYTITMVENWRNLYLGTGWCGMYCLAPALYVYPLSTWCYLADVSINLPGLLPLYLHTEKQSNMWQRPENEARRCETKIEYMFTVWGKIEKPALTGNRTWVPGLSYSVPYYWTPGNHQLFQSSLNAVQVVLIASVHTWQPFSMRCHN